MELKPNTIIAERFRLTRLLGEGGMGAVWLADHVRLKVPCAVKLMRPEVAKNPAYRARFDREAVIAAQIRSPEVVQILDHGLWEGTPYIAMEYLEGEDLQERLARVGKLSPAETRAIVVPVARALAKAHAAGLVHRDLKPANIFLVRDDDREIVKVLDFGIAKDTGVGADEQTKTGTIMGTPFYMSPEQAQGKRQVDHRTDLWALAVIIFRCLTGKLPFSSNAFGDLVIQIVVEPLPVPSAVAPVPPGFDAFWAKGVARDPDARFQSARELVDALTVALGLSDGSSVATSVPDAPAVKSATVEGATTPSVSTEVGLAGSSETNAPRRRRSYLFAAVLAVGLIGAGIAFFRPDAAPNATADTTPAPSSASSDVVVAPAPPRPAASPAVAIEVTPPSVASSAPSAASAPPAPAAVTAAPPPSPTPSTSPPRPPPRPSSAPVGGRDIGF